MTNEDNLQSERDDFRCNLCRHRGAFQCEHDTPYRDQYLGIFDPNLPRDIAVNGVKQKKNTRIYNNSTNNGRGNTERQINRNTDVNNQKNKKLDKKNVTTKNTNETTTTTTTTSTEKQKPAKSCVIQ